MNLQQNEGNSIYQSLVGAEISLKASNGITLAAVDSDLSSEDRYLVFEQLGPGEWQHIVKQVILTKFSKLRLTGLYDNK